MAVIIGVALLLGVGGLIWWLHARHFETTDDAFIDGHIIHVSPRVAGRVISLNVNDNELVPADKVVINIDPAPFEAALNQAKAAQQQAEAKLEQAKADQIVAQANSEQARADVLVAEANATNAARDLTRYQNLMPAARSQQQLDAATAAQQSTAANLVAAKKRVASVEAQVQSAATNVEAARAAVSAAVAQVQQSSLDLQYTQVTAGQRGFVTRRTVEAGNFVQVGQDLMTIVQPDVWVTANYKETQLRRMRRGQEVTIHVDAYPDRKLKGHVDSIQTGTGAVFSLLPPENATGNFVKIVQRIPVKIVFDDDPNGRDYVLSPGMSVEPRVKVR